MVEYIIKKDGVELARVEDIDVDTEHEMPNAVWVWILKHQGQSVYYACKWGGYTYEKKGGDKR